MSPIGTYSRSHGHPLLLPVAQLNGKPLYCLSKAVLCVQEMARDLVDRIDWVLTASAAPARPADRPQHLGLQKCPPGKVQTSYLAVLLHVCCLTNSWAGFGLRAFPKWVYLWKVAVKQHVWVPHPEGKKTALQEDSLTEDRIRSKLPHGILIYIRMVGEYSMVLGLPGVMYILDTKARVKILIVTVCMPLPSSPDHTSLHGWLLYAV